MEDNKRDFTVSHEQISCMTCCPMAVEFVLKYHHIIAGDSYPFQGPFRAQFNPDHASRFGFGHFDERCFGGALFHAKNHLHNEELIEVMKEQAKGGKLTILSLPSGGGNYHSRIGRFAGWTSTEGKIAFDTVTRNYGLEGGDPKPHMVDPMDTTTTTDVLVYSLAECGGDCSCCQNKGKREGYPKGNIMDAGKKYEDEIKSGKS